MVGVGKAWVAGRWGGCDGYEMVEFGDRLGLGFLRRRLCRGARICVMNVGGRCGRPGKFQLFYPCLVYFSVGSESA